MLNIKLMLLTSENSITLCFTLSESKEKITPIKQNKFCQNGTRSYSDIQKIQIVVYEIIINWLITSGRLEVGQ